MKTSDVLLFVMKEIDKDVFGDVVNFGTRSTHMPRIKPYTDKELFAKTSLEVVKLPSNSITDFKKELEMIA